MTTEADGFDQSCDAHCTLREAVGLAGPVDTIRVPPGRYTLASELGLPGVRIVGAGARSTTIAAVESRVLYAYGDVTTISGVAITGGSGTGEVSSGWGGGVYVAEGASLTLVDAAVTGNFARFAGGGIFNAGALVLERSVVSDNEAGVDGEGEGGGIHGGFGTTELLNTTVSGNSAGRAGGGIGTFGALTLESATIADNSAEAGAGIHSFIVAFRRQAAGEGEIRNTIVAGNDGPACGSDSGSAPWMGDHDLDDDGTCGFAGPGVLSGLDPQLGPLAANGGPTATHALPAGSPAIDAGADCPATDQRGTARAGACDIGAYEYVAPPPATTGQQQQPAAQQETPLPPRPVAGESVNAEPKRGTVRIKLPGRKRFRKLGDGALLPVGTVVDARKGRIRLTAAGGQAGTFHGGVFKIGQGKGARPLTTLRLVERLACKPSAKKASTAAKKKRKRKRRLWGNGKGRFRTKGKHSAATVVGTKWLVEDRCRSTLTRVVRGRVKVRDFVKKKTVTVRKGKKYVARAKG